MNYPKMRKILLDVLNETLNYIDPANLIKSSVKISDGKLIANNVELDLHSVKRIFVIGGGKAVGRMALGIESILSDKISDGLIIVPYGSNISTLRRIKVIEARHPIPDQNGVNGVRMMLELLKSLDKNDLVIVLISGGGSALMPLPVDGITLEEKSDLIKSLMLRGANIRELNTVRKHLSKIKGGQLARYLYPANVLSLIISDVVENPLDVIASGPTVPDPTTFSDAINVLKRYNLWESTTEKVRDVLLKGVKGELLETPKHGDPIFEHVHNIIIADNSYACRVAVKVLERKGIHGIYLSSSIEGEARYVGSVIGDIVRGMAKGETSLEKPLGLVIGGETTVTVKGSGIGGRNQELCLSAAFRIRGLKNVILTSIGTDGIDGVTDAAGAIVDGNTIDRGLALGLDPTKYLENNDTYTFFKSLNDLVITGPTGNNMNDIIIALIF
ncbi:MAG: glycerate kinase [Thermoprotei archaeon]